MSSGISSSLPATTAILPAGGASQPKTIEGAAQQFEALMIGEMLKTARETGSSGLAGDEEDSTGGTMLDVADQQFAQLLAHNGGLGLAAIVARGLK